MKWAHLHGEDFELWLFENILKLILKPLSLHSSKLWKNHVQFKHLQFSESADEDWKLEEQQVNGLWFELILLTDFLKLFVDIENTSKHEHESLDLMWNNLI